MSNGWPRERAQAHLERLAFGQDITIHWTEKPPHASSKHKMAFCNPPTTAKRYLFALHELGHCSSQQAIERERQLKVPASRFDTDSAEMICEAFAWAWASEMADLELTALATKRQLHEVITSGWGTYLIHCLKSAGG
jgi:hypothetical protein